MGTKNNNLLKENTVRRFMKLANVGTFTNNFVNERFAEDEDLNENEEENLEEQDMPEMDEEPEGEDDMGMDQSPDMEMDMGDDMDMDDEPGDADMSLTEEEAELLISLGERLKAAMEGDADAGEEMDEPMDDMPAEDDMGDLGGMEDEEEEPAPGGGRAYLQEEDDDEDLKKESIVNEVLKRVTKRIVSENLRRK
tara:strand:+ start:12898 stop:13482 length:585 start_codon:yes stop_codon:yes gene_type:complete